MQDDRQNKLGRWEAVAGVAVMGGLVTGLFSLLVAMMSMAPGGPPEVTAGALVAAALAFGLVSNALLRR